MAKKAKALEKPELTNAERVIQKQLVEAGVKNLKEFGYPHVDSTNIFTGMIERTFFKRMLEDTKSSTTDTGINNTIRSLLEQIKACESKA